MLNVRKKANRIRLALCIPWSMLIYATLIHNYTYREIKVGESVVTLVDPNFWDVITFLGGGLSLAVCFIYTYTAINEWIERGEQMTHPMDEPSEYWHPSNQVDTCTRCSEAVNPDESIWMKGNPFCVNCVEQIEKEIDERVEKVRSEYG